jgi:hypothetical protein
MADDTDFIALYRDLDLAADCSLDALKRAYRRRVAELHPDRRGGDEDASAELKTLNLRYAAALEFVRRHGRLPGAAPTPARRTAATRMGVHRGAAATDSGAGPGSGSGDRRGLRVVLATLVLAGATWMFLPTAPVGDTGYSSGVAIPVGGGPARRPATPLQLGMTPAQVLATQGEPLAADGMRWLYGPSWIVFQCDQVADWYSSALRPLTVQHQRPVPSEAGAAAVRRRHCPPMPPPDPRPRPPP